MKFVVDASLGRLAKWLRLSGFDTVVRVLPPHPARLPQPNPEIMHLTRKTAWESACRDDVLVLRANDPEEQLAEVVRRLKLPRRSLNPLSRCGECNEPLVSVPRDAAMGLVPDYVFYSQDKFYQCPRCQRLYWPGSHLPRITAKIRKIFHGRGKNTSPPAPSRKGVPHVS